MNNNTALPLTRRVMAIYVAALTVCITTAITTATSRRHAEQLRTERIRDDIRLIERAERQIAIR
jgi:hypothetical protein